jgi:hypothetical protein
MCISARALTVKLGRRYRAQIEDCQSMERIQTYKIISDRDIAILDMYHSVHNALRLARRRAAGGCRSLGRRVRHLRILIRLRLHRRLRAARRARLGRRRRGRRGSSEQRSRVVLLRLDRVGGVRLRLWLARPTALRGRRLGVGVGVLVDRHGRVLALEHLLVRDDTRVRRALAPGRLAALRLLRLDRGGRAKACVRDRVQVVDAREVQDGLLFVLRL